ncbi:MAG TPA: hypothetical protein VF077_13280 [Nitrospiraceae bacterium]
MIILVHPSDVCQEWPAIARYIEDAMKLCRVETPEDLMRACSEDKAQLWIDEYRNAAAVSFVIQGRERVLQVVALGGNEMSRWLASMVSEWRTFARSNGCSAVVASGRKGWERMFREYGVVQTAISGVMEV